MLAHHATVFNKLVASNPDADVFITTSDKTEPGKSPFNFKEKQLVATAQGIDPNKMLQVRRNYHPDDLAPYIEDPDNTAIFFAVGEKDMQEDARFKFDNMDKKTGLSMKPNGDPYYFQMINTYKTNPKSMMDRGYVKVVKTEIDDIKNEILSASAFRKQILDAPDKESAKKVFNRYFKEYNESVFNLVYKNIVGEKMNEDLNTILKLAGLEMREDAPVEFDTPVSIEDVNFAPVTKSSARMSIANRFPEGSDVNDSDVKKEQFVQALLKSPANLLAEINERIMPDENGLMVSDKLNKLIDKMPENGLKGMDDEDKQFALKIAKKAISDMDLEAGDDIPYEPEDSGFEKESLDLSDIKSDYGVEEGTKEGPQGMIVYDDDKPLSLSDWKHENKKEGGDTWKDEEASQEAYKKYLKTVGKKEMAEGGNAFDIAMTDAEASIMDCDSEEDCLKDLNAMKYNNPEDADEMMADDVIQSYIDMVEKFGLEKIKAKIDSEMNAPEPTEEGILDKHSYDPVAPGGQSSKRKNLHAVGDTVTLDGAKYSVVKVNLDAGTVDVKDASGKLLPNVEAGVFTVEAEVEQEPKNPNDPRDPDTGITGAIEPEDDTKVDTSVYNRMRGDIKGKDAASIMQKALDVGAGDSNMAPYLQKVMQPLMTKVKDMMSHRKYADKLHQIMVQFDNEMGQKPVMASKDYDESFDASAEQSREEEAYEDLMNALQSGGEEAYAEACGLSMEELDQEMGEISRDLNLHMDDDRDEIIQRHAEDTVDSADWKDHGEPEVDEDIQRMRDLAGIKEKEQTEPCPKCGKERIVLKACSGCGCS